MARTACPVIGANALLRCVVWRDWGEHDLCSATGRPHCRGALHPHGRAYSNILVIEADTLLRHVDWRDQGEGFSLLKS